MYKCVRSGRVFKQLKTLTAIYEPVAEWSKALRSTYYVQQSISFCSVGSNQGCRPIHFYTVKPLSHFANGYSLYRLSFETKICIHMYLCFNPFSVQPRLTMYHRTVMHTHVCIYMWAQCHVCRCARIMQIHIPMIAEVKMFQRLNMLYVHHMHTLVCRVFKWNYEQLLYGQTFLPTDIRFARANAPLTTNNKAMGWGFSLNKICWNISSQFIIA